MRLALPDAVEHRLTHLGRIGHQWRSDLAGHLDRLSGLWSLDFGAVLHGGSEALVIEAQARSSVDEPLVLKLLLPAAIEPGQTEVFTNNERNVLTAAKGRGYVRLYKHDEASGAMLLPRLGEPLGKLEKSPQVQQKILCGLLRQSWQTSGTNLGLPTGAQKAVWLGNLIRALAVEFSQPIAQTNTGAGLTPQALDIALEFTKLRQRAHERADKVLVHGDAHEWNALRADDNSYRLIDPDGLYAQPEYDMGVLMREASEELLDGEIAPIERGMERCNRLASCSGTDATAIWQWGFIERVSSGLYTLKLNLPEYGQPALAVANSWARQNARDCFG